MCASPAVIVSGFCSITALTRATTTIPIVMWGVSYPVEAGLVKSLLKPGGNVTGVIDNPLDSAPSSSTC